MPGLIKSNPLNVKIGARLKAIREMHGITQVELAKRLTITRTSLTNMEAGRQNFMLQHFCAYAKALRVPVEKLFAFCVK